MRKKIDYLTRVDEDYLKREVINIYTLLFKIEKIENKIYKKVS